MLEILEFGIITGFSLIPIIFGRVAVEGNKGATASDVWNNSTRELTGITGTPRNNLIGADQALQTELDNRNVDKTHMDRIDANISTRSTLTKSEVNTEVDSALNTAIPGSPTADSINERVKQLDDNFTSVQANRIDENVSAVKKQDITTTTGTFTLADNTNEQDVLEFTGSTNVITVSIDKSKLTNSGTFRAYEKVDGTNYRILDSTATGNLDGDAYEFSFDAKGRDVKITYQADTTEGATRDMPHARNELVRS